MSSVLKRKDVEIRTAKQKRKTSEQRWKDAETDHREKEELVKERDQALMKVEERRVVEKIVKQFVNDYNARLVFIIGLSVGLGIGALVTYLIT